MMMKHPTKSHSYEWFNDSFQLFSHYYCIIVTHFSGFKPIILNVFLFTKTEMLQNAIRFWF